MRDPLVIAWTIAVVLSGFWFRWCMRRYQRSMDSKMSIHILVFVIVSSIIGLALQYTLKNSLHIVWATRVALLVLGSFHVWSLFRMKWVKRDPYVFLKDSMWPELASTVTIALACSMAFVLSPRLFSLPFVSIRIPRIPVDYTMWDAPVVFLLPFLAYKLADFASQIPYRFVEKIWYYPQELLSAEKIPWRDLIRVNFVVANTLRDEYRIIGRRSHPWIEIPNEIQLEKAFRFMVQERRKKQGLTIVQDLGSEYGGEPQFWWLFRVKIVPWKPSTWRRKPRYLNPELSIQENRVRGGDIIIATRVPAEKDMLPANRPWEGNRDFDPDRTTLLSR